MFSPGAPDAGFPGGVVIALRLTMPLDLLLAVVRNRGVDQWLAGSAGTVIVTSASYLLAIQIGMAYVPDTGVAGRIWALAVMTLGITSWRLNPARHDRLWRVVNRSAFRDDSTEER